MRRTHGCALHCCLLPPLHAVRPAGYTLLVPALHVARTAGPTLLPAAPLHAARPATRPPLATPHIVRVRPTATHMLRITPYAVFAVSPGCGARRARRGVRCADFP